MEGAVATVTTDRPSRHNALNSLVLRELVPPLRCAADDATVSVIGLTVIGLTVIGRSAPAAIWRQEAARGVRWGCIGTGKTFAQLLLTFRELGKPVIARVNGDALGGGFGLMLACDLVVAREDARLGCPEINAGCSR